MVDMKESLIPGNYLRKILFRDILSFKSTSYFYFGRTLKGNFALMLHASLIAFRCALCNNFMIRDRSSLFEFAENRLTG